jgi:hypothetical protein
MRRLGTAVLVLLFSASPLFSQNGGVSPDTLANDVVFLPDIGFPVESPPENRIKSPTVAVALSAVLPGAGQIYNGSYWKTPIILSFAAYFTYAVVILQDAYTDYRQRYRNSITDENPRGNDRLRQIRDIFRDRRDGFIWNLGYVYLISMVDAYVEAVLSGFDVGEDLTLRIDPFIDGRGGAGMRFRLEF